MLYRALEMKPDLRKMLIDYLKKGIKEENEQNNISDLLDILSGLAINKTNIPDIVSDNFIQTVAQFVKSPNEDIKYNSLELLLLITNARIKENDQLIQNLIGDLNFIVLIGQKSQLIDMLVLKKQLEWNSDNEQLSKMDQLYQILSRLSNEQEELQIQTSKQEIIPLIVHLLINANVMIIKQEQKQEQFPLLSLGIISCCCFVIAQIIIINKNTALDFLGSQIPKVLFNVLNHLPVSLCKNVHIQAMFYLTNNSSFALINKIEQLGTILVINRFLKHPSSSIFKTMAVTLFNVLNVFSSLATQKTKFPAELPNFSKYPIFDELQNDDVLKA
ncbi:MAG: hypothetical protein EZS28_004757 [Streblomastix strix]|uniref:Uncharacterized protein n=1 Tax=Streblomastix strix TaxID=222440 RepID=A0A5J4WY29_9EUKA|nr:MAG: hypothetical protein EZS28_004757 [Streblomastix strix]